MSTQDDIRREEYEAFLKAGEKSTEQILTKGLSEIQQMLGMKLVIFQKHPSLATPDTIVSALKEAVYTCDKIAEECGFIEKAEYPE